MNARAERNGRYQVAGHQWKSRTVNEKNHY